MAFYDNWVQKAFKDEVYNQSSWGEIETKKTYSSQSRQPLNHKTRCNCQKQLRNTIVIKYKQYPQKYNGEITYLKHVIIKVNGPI